MVLNTINCYLREMEKNKHSPFKNYAFISYNSLDRREAEKLQRKLEHYKLPKTTRNEIKDSKYLRDIWRDVTNLRGDIDEEIRKQLSLSKYLIVICSPNSANPLSYVNKEVDYYANILGRGDYIIPYIIKGVPYSNNPDTECFPKALRDYNLNHNKNIYGYDVNDLGHSLAFIKVVAEMLDVDVEMLWQRFKRDRRKRIARRIVVTLLLFIIMLYIWRPVRLNFTLEDKNHSSLPEMRDAKLIVNNREYHVDGNNLTIKPTKDGAIDITLTKKMPYNSAYELFVGDGIQNMMIPGTTDPVIAKIRVNSYYGEVELTKKDKETNETTPQGQATLKNAEYGVYEQATGKLVTTIKTDENGYGKSPKVLPYNSYYLQEINASEGYLLDNTKYNFDLKGKENEKLDVFETVVKNYISILKQYEFVDGETTFLNAEKGITFEIFFPNGDKFDEITTDKNGYATINLPYGVWKFHQVNSTTGYEKIYDFFITVDYNSEKEQYYNILNNALSAYLQVFKTDIETGKTIALANTTFKIYNKDTKQYVSQYVGGKVYSEFKTDEDGRFISFLKLVAGNYKLIETESPQG